MTFDQIAECDGLGVVAEGNTGRHDGNQPTAFPDHRPCVKHMIYIGLTGKWRVHEDTLSLTFQLVRQKIRLNWRKPQTFQYLDIARLQFHGNDVFCTDDCRSFDSNVAYPGTWLRTVIPGSSCAS